MRSLIFCVVVNLICLTFSVKAQTFSITGKIISEEKKGLIDVTVSLKQLGYFTLTDEKGMYKLKNIKPGTYILTVYSFGYEKIEKQILISNQDLTMDLILKDKIHESDSIVVVGKKEKLFGVTHLNDVEGTAIYAGKKSEVIEMKNITANTATNNSRQIYSKIAGLNIWENDGAGIQLAIGGRGLSPNRTTNFNTRQNGYDMSADALGYPESYYSPPTEALERIEVVRGAASLQYGTQFGGMVNFKLKKGLTDKKAEIIFRQTRGSWRFSNTFISVGGTIKKINYYFFYQRKTGDGWRPNSQFNVNTAYGSAIYNISSKFSVTTQYTFMEYLAHQPGGLTDQMFDDDPHQSVRSRNWFKVNWNLAAVLFDYKFSSRLKLNSRFYGLVASRSALGILDYINRVDPLDDRDLWTDNYRNFGNETRLIYKYSIGKVVSTALIGFRYYNGHTDRKQGLGNDGYGGAKSDFMFNNAQNLEYSKYTFPNHNTAVFAENIFQITPKLSIIPGVRFENIQTVADGFYNIVNLNQSGDTIYYKKTIEHRVNKRSFVIGGIGMSYNKNKAVNLYANFSQNYRAINFNDMRVINPNFRVDPNLKDEKGYSTDIGLRGNISSIINYDLSLFMIYYKNRIGTVIEKDTATYNLYQLRTNISDSRNVGLESFIEVDVWRLLNGENSKSKVLIFSNFSFINARYIHSQTSAFENKKVELAPNVIFKTGISYRTNKFSVSYQFSYTSSQFSDATNAIKTDNAIYGLIPAYHVMDLSAKYEINKKFSFSGSINNLANNMYFTRRADSYPGPGIIPSDARSFFLTLQVML
ncbi:MAG TPA: TonB-dependent receptor [Cytophagaceae bacterium]|nr:TonB-dependent receptor [Cytophagaceae bacterium]